MFRIYITLAYLLPGIYLFLRINQLFIEKGYKIIFSIIFALIFLIFPLSGFFVSADSNAFQRILAKISGYLLPFFLYVFLLILLYDLFLIINYFPQWLPVEIRRTFGYRFYLFVSIIIVSSLVVIGGVINLNTIQISKYKVSVPRKNSDIKKLRVAYIADFHIHPGVAVGFVEKYVSKIKELNPDLLLYGGDIVDDRKIHPEKNKIISLFKELNPPYGVFGVLGNHEVYRGHTDGLFFQQAGITLLNDTLVAVGNNFIIAGRYDEHFRNRKTVNEILGSNITDLPVLMLDHRPTQLEEVSKTKVDAQFSGHTHNGQLFPFNYIIKRIYRLGWGYLKMGNTHFFVTSGLRLWGPPVKTTGKAEIMLVDFTFE